MIDGAPLQALMLPFATGALALPEGGVLFLNARVFDAQAFNIHGGLDQRGTMPALGLVVEQTARPLADALRAAGHVFAPADDAGQRYRLVLVLPPRQRDAMRALFARAFACCAVGGTVVASVANAAGAKSAEADLRRLAGGLSGSLCKHHCRVFWATHALGPSEHALLAQWRELDAPRRIAAPSLPGGVFLSRPGVFAWDRIDPGSALLAAHLPRDLAGHGADLGAGWGYLSIETLRCNPGVRALDLYEAEARALALARANLAETASAAVLDFLWHDVTGGLPREYDFITTNPPFHAQDRADRPWLGQRFIAVAAQALRPGGRLLLVANRQLPYEATLDAHFHRVRTLAQDGGFKVVEAVRAG